VRQRFEVQWCVFVSGCELDGSQVRFSADAGL